MVIVYGIAIFVSAALLFSVQPLIGRLVLPQLGGSPAVWNTVMLFFQASLLAGYALAHGIASLRRPEWRLGVHAALAIGALAVLPVGLPLWEAPGAGAPVPWLLGALVVGVGLPAVTLGTMGPLLQWWYARSGLPRAHDPYFLYAASNAGSLIGLTGYPLLVEPTLGLGAQQTGWSFGFAALGALLVFIWMRSLRSDRGTSIASDTPAAAAAQPGMPRRWIMLALVPSSLLLGVTQHITTDIAAVPLLWALPLALYLVSFIIAFSVRTDRVIPIASRAAAVLVVALVVAMLIEAKHPLLLVLSLHLAAFFAVAVACHARLAASRPAASRLTRFYFFVSLGGVLGGAVNALLAPVVFDWIAEYPIMLAIGGGLALGAMEGGVRSWRRAWPVLIVAAGVAGAAWWLPHGEGFRLGIVGLSALACYVLSSRPIAFGGALLAVLILPMIITPDAQILRRDRTFFGVHTVVSASRHGVTLHELRHGGTVHGLQIVGDPTPRTYYHPDGPLGDIMELAHDTGPIRVGAIGLGVGSLAALAQPGDSIVFFEIDPMVIDIASDTELFTFLDDSDAMIEHVVGDGRLTIAGRGPFNLIVLDAFTSDAIPVHLLTAEAFGVYAAELAPGGRLAVHVSNRHLDLAPVIGATAHAAGLGGLVLHHEPTEAQAELGVFESSWMLLAPDRATLSGSVVRRWSPMETGTGAAVWTDDRADILSVLRLD